LGFLSLQTTGQMEAPPSRTSLLTPNEAFRLRSRLVRRDSSLEDSFLYSIKRPSSPPMQISTRYLQFGQYHARYPRFWGSKFS
jgi:hypothetical protein